MKENKRGVKYLLKIGEMATFNLPISATRIAPFLLLAGMLTGAQLSEAKQSAISTPTLIATVESGVTPLR